MTKVKPGHHRDTIVRLAKASTPRDEIARQTGLTVAQVYGVIQHARRNDEQIPELPGGTPADSDWVRLSQSLKSMLEADAARRGISPAALARRLLFTVARENLVDSVLDDADEIAEHIACGRAPHPEAWS